jgi:hypothetical protein
MVEPTDVATSGDLHVDDATVASRAFIVKNSPPPQTPHSQQPLILRGSGDYGYGAQDASEATSRVEQVQYNNTQVPPQQLPGSSYAGYQAPSGGGYSPLPSSYPVQNTGSYPPQVPPNYQLGTPYTEIPIGGYPQYSSQALPRQRAINAKGRTTGLILVLIGLLLIMGAAVLFAMQQGLIGGIRAGADGYRVNAALAVVSTHTYMVELQSRASLYHQSRSSITITIPPAS